MVYIKKWSWSSLVAQWLRTPHFHCQVLGSIRAQGTDILANGIARKLKKKHDCYSSPLYETTSRR